MNARKLCAGTQRDHIRACKRFAAFLKRSPDTATCAVKSPLDRLSQPKRRRPKKAEKSREEVQPPA
jgi:hypothetical protein